jgi:hypothetical protein
MVGDLHCIMCEEEGVNGDENGARKANTKFWNKKFG